MAIEKGSYKERRKGKSFIRKFRILLKKALLTNDSPEKLARGFAIGVFWGVLPTFGLAALFSLPTAILLKANRLTAIVGTFVSNPFTIPFYILWATQIGNFILKIGKFHFSWQIFNIKYLLLLSRSLLVGSIILATIMAFSSYGIFLLIFPFIRKAFHRTARSSSKG